MEPLKCSVHWHISLCWWYSFIGAYSSRSA